MTSHSKRKPRKRRQSPRRAPPVDRKAEESRGRLKRRIIGLESRMVLIERWYEDILVLLGVGVDGPQLPDGEE